MARPARSSVFRVRVAFFALVTLVAVAGFADDAKPSPDRLARIGEILQAVGWAHTPSADFFRTSDDASGDDADLRIWTLSARGGAPKRLTDDAGYTWPVFGPDGKSVAALGHDGLVVIDASKKRRVVWEPPADDPPKVVLAWTPLGISVATLSGRVVLVNAETGIFSTVDRAPVGVVVALVQATRSCGDSYVDTAAGSKTPATHGGDGRADVLLHTKAKSTPRTETAGSHAAVYASRNLTQALKTERHLEPALSPDCQHVVFVAGQ
jgi:hypothetical protein